MKKNNSLKSVKSFWKWELITAKLYGYLADRYSNATEKNTILKLRKMELGHAQIWNKIADSAYSISFEQTILIKFQIYMSKLFALILPLTMFIHYLEHQERQAILQYSFFLESYKENEKVTKMIINVIKEEIGHEWQLMEQLADKTEYIIKAKEAIHGLTAGILETLGLVIGLLAVQTTTSIIGLSGLLAGTGGLIAIITISYVSAKGHYDLHEGKAKELSVKTELHPASLNQELKNALVKQGIGPVTAKNIISAIKDNTAVLSQMVQTIKTGVFAVAPREAAVTTSLFFIIGTLPVLIPFFIGVFWDSGPLIPAVFAFAFAVIIISVSGLFIGVLSGQKITSKIIYNILIIAGTCTATYLIGLAARLLFGIEAGH